MKKFCTTWIIIIGILVLFFPFWEDLYCKIIVNPILSRYEPSLANDIIVIFLCLFILIKGIRRAFKSYNGLFEKNSFIFLFIVNILFVFIYIYKSEYHYATFSFSSIPLFCAIFGVTSVILIYSIIIFTIRYYTINPKLWTEKFYNKILENKLLNNFRKNLETHSWILKIIFGRQKKTKKDISEPKIDLSEDEIIGIDYILHIAQLLKNIPNYDHSYAIGILGQWGDGKSTFLNFLKKKLKNDFIIIDFNAWCNSSPRNLVTDFFKTLRNELTIYNPNLSQPIKEYARLLAQCADSKYGKILSKILNFFDSSHDLTEEYKHVKKEIEKIDKKVIICLDDLDRLDKEELIEIIRLIRNTANFGNTIFLATYDKEYLNSALKEYNEYRSDHFLEKIFQQEIILPDIESFVLKNKLIGVLRQKLNSKCDWLEKIIFSHDEFSYPKFSFFFKNMRDIIRFANVFSSPFLIIEKDIYPIDFFYLHLLRFRFPEIYNLLKIDSIWSHPYASSFFTFTSVSNNNVIILKKTSKEDISNQKNEIPFKFENLLKEQKYAENEIDQILKILKTLFPHTKGITESFEESNDYKRLHLSINYRKYFTFKNPLNTISTEELLLTFSKPMEDIKEQISKWVENNKQDYLKLYFKDYLFPEIKTKFEYEKIITSFLFFANQKDHQYNKVTIEDSPEFIAKYISFKYGNRFYQGDREAYKIFLTGLFEKTETLPLIESNIIRQKRLEIAEAKYGFNDEKWAKELESDLPFIDANLLDFNMEFLKRYISSSREVTAPIFWLYHNCDIYTEGAIGKKGIKNKIAGELLIEFAKEKDLKNFLTLLVEHTRGGDEYFNLSKLVLDLFETFETFETFLTSIHPKEPYYTEFYRFYEKTKKKSYQEVFFQFNYLNVNRYQEY